jgi:hypothetical protein
MQKHNECADTTVHTKEDALLITCGKKDARSDSISAEAKQWLIA